jgi:hypothetical protein
MDARQGTCVIRLCGLREDKESRPVSAEEIELGRGLMERLSPRGLEPELTVMNIESARAPLDWSRYLPDGGSKREYADRPTRKAMIASCFTIY